MVGSGLTTPNGEGGVIKGGEKDVDEEVGDTEGGYVLVSRRGAGKGRAGEGEREGEAFHLADGHALAALDRSRMEARSVARS
jgi:hypothetical protein